MDTRKGFLWVVANTIGAGLGWVCCVNLTNTTDLPTMFNFPGPLDKNVYEYSVILGGTIGLAQWLVLSPLVKPAKWIPATIAGWVIGFTASSLTFVVLFFILYSIASPLTYLVICAVSGSVLGIFIGIFQWLIFYTQVTRIAEQWILANIWALGISYVLLIEGLYGVDNNDLNPEASRLFFVTVFGLIYGSITAKVLVKLRQD